MPIVRSKFIRPRVDKTISYMSKCIIYVLRIFNFFPIFIKSSWEDFIYKSIKSIVFIASILILITSEISVSYFGKDNLNSIIFGLIPVIMFMLIYFILIKRLSFKEVKK